MRRVFFSLVLFGLAVSAGAQDLRLPMKNGSIKFAVIGDSGTGNSDQMRVGKQIATFRSKFPFDFAILLGDNLYGSERSTDYQRKFEIPYKALLDGGVKFYAALGNHDDPNQRLYKPFNMNGNRYYTFRPTLTGGVRFFAIDSNYIDPKQMEWLEKELAASGSDWKVAFFHHPPYASGMHGSHEEIRAQLEPLFVKYGVNAVFNGHEHFYERIKVQKGIQYFVAGASGKIRRGDISKTNLTAVGYDQGFSFMLVEISGEEMTFQTITDTGKTIDFGVIRKAANSNTVIETTTTATGRGTTGAAAGTTGTVVAPPTIGPAPAPKPAQPAPGQPRK